MNKQKAHLGKEWLTGSTIDDLLIAQLGSFCTALNASCDATAIVPFHTIYERKP